jgi:ABC-2 type transport system ATP-binding protein
VDGLIELVGLADAGRKATRNYSLGMKQRLGVATALIKNPTLLVLDEPANGLDPAGMRDMRDLLIRLRDDGRTVLLSSHLLTEVEQVADRIGIIDRGRMKLIGTVDDLRARAGARVLIDARPAGRAAAVLAASELLPESSVKLEAGTVAVTLPRTSEPGEAEDAIVPRLVRELVDNGLSVHRVVNDERSLTDLFLTLTSEGIRS